MLNQDHIGSRINHFLWERSLESVPWWELRLVWFFRLVYVLWQDIAFGQLTLRAMSLVFTTLLSMVPLLAVSFSVLKAFGGRGHDLIGQVLLYLLAPLGDKGIEVADYIIGFVDNIQVGFLGSLGLLFLFYTVVSLIQKVESAFNYIWQLEQNRTLLRRFSDYLSVIFVGPVLVFSALGLSAAVKSATLMQALITVEPFGLLLSSLSFLMPYVLIIAAFTFVYKFIPNTIVNTESALFGGIVSGIVWQSCSWVFASVVVGSTQYTAIYSSFAILIIFMIWIYLNWLILLLGSSVTYFRQYPDNLIPNRYDLKISIADHERLALDLLYVIGERFHKRDTPLTIFEIVDCLSMPYQLIERSLNDLVSAGVIVKTSDRVSTFIPAIPLDSIKLSMVLKIVRGEVDRYGAVCSKNLHSSVLNGVINNISDLIERDIGEITLKDIIDKQSTVL